jgi:hypothetical protein
MIKVTGKGIVASKLVLPKDVKVTRRSIIEYAEELKKRYLRASKEEKGKMLDEFTQVTGWHRKAAIRLLNSSEKPGAGKKCGRPREIRRRGLTTTRPANLLKSSIPIRTFADWQENKPGFMEAGQH